MSIKSSLSYRWPAKASILENEGIDGSDMNAATLAFSHPL